MQISLCVDCRVQLNLFIHAYMEEINIRVNKLQKEMLATSDINEVTRLRQRRSMLMVARAAYSDLYHANLLEEGKE